MKGSNYAAWDIKPESFPANASIEDKINFLIGYGILAPSTHNTQPWLFKIDQNQLIITANPDLTLPQADPSGRNLQISLGCLTTNILVAAERFGLSVSSSWSPKYIKLSFQPGPAGTSDRLLRAIPARYSDKLAYRLVPLGEVHKNKLTKVAPQKGCQLSLVTDKATINQIADIQQAAALAYGANRRFFHELSQWLRPSKTKSQDGMPGFVVGLSNPQSKALKTVIRKFKPAVKLLAKKDLAAILSSSAVGFITTNGDDPESWFRAGQYYETLALEATANGLVTAPMASIIEHQSSKAKTKQLLKLKQNPQLFFRLGYSSHKPYHTPRRILNIISMDTQQKLANIIKTPLEHKQIKIDSYVINYVVAGSGKPLLLLHGANIGWAQWYQNIAELAKHYKVYALDLPGAGNSTKVNFHKTDLEKDFLRIVDKFVATQKFNHVDIIGSSFGGWIALKLAIERRPYINRIVLTNPLGFTSYMPPQFKPVSLRPLALVLSKTVLKPKRSNKNLEKFMRDVFYDKQQPLANEFVDYFYELSKTSHNILFINRLAHISGMRKELFLKKDLPKINRPILVIWGMKDPLMPFKTVEEQIDLIPGVKLEKLEDVGHMPPVEAAAKFNLLATNFLKAK